jgi:hypothetical protein
MASFRENFVANLPADPEQALLVLADRAEEWMGTPDDGNSQSQGIVIRAVLDAFIRRFRPEILGDDVGVDGLDVRGYVNSIMKHAGTIEAERLIDQYEEEAGGRNFGKAELTPAEKDKVHSHLRKIRSLIEESDLPAKKKNGLMDRLNALAAEVDRQGTRTDRFFGLASDLGFYLGDFAEKSAPLWKEVRETLKVITKARARDENLTLPPGEEILSLPGRPASDDDTNDKGSEA